MTFTRPTPDLRIEDGPPANEILRVARAENTELLVVGSVERKALSRFLLGSVSAKVVRAAPCSVYVHKTAARK
ncbi:MAG: universal stress protein [Myxococcaceae bacterium]